MRYKVIMPGFPGRSSRGFLGWSSVVYLPEQKFLFDTGGYPERYQLLSLLRENGIGSAEIRGLIVSHMHFDHAANLTLFPNAKIYVQAKELVYALTDGGGDLALFAEPLLQESIRRRLVPIEVDTWEIEGIVLLQTPGHTPGSMVAFLPESKTILAGDALKNVAEVTSSMGLMTVNQEASQKSIARILGLAETIVPGHDRLIRRQGDSFVPVGESMVRIELPVGLGKDVMLRV